MCYEFMPPKMTRLCANDAILTPYRVLATAKAKAGAIYILELLWKPYPEVN